MLTGTGPFHGKLIGQQIAIKFACKRTQTDFSRFSRIWTFVEEKKKAVGEREEIGEGEAIFEFPALRHREPGVTAADQDGE